MIRRHLVVLRLALMIVDGLSAAIVFALVSLVRFGEGAGAGLSEVLRIDARAAALLFALAWVFALQYVGLYRLRIRWRLVTEAQDIVKATLVVLVVTLSVLFILKQDAVSRSFLALLFVTQPLVTLAGRACLRYGFGVLRRRGHNTRYMLIAGAGPLAQEFADRVEARSSLGIRVIGHVSSPGDVEGAVSRPVLGLVGEIATVFHAQVVDEVAVCLPESALHYVEPVTRLATDEGKTVRIVMDPIDDRVASVKQEVFDGFLVRSVIQDDQHELGLIAKRLIDVAGALVGLVILSPVLLGTAVVIGFREGSTILFRQTRVGLHGRPFTIYKFRTMVPDAEARLVDVAHLNMRQGHAFKAVDDPRVTRAGTLLRRSSRQRPGRRAAQRGRPDQCVPKQQGHDPEDGHMAELADDEVEARIRCESQICLGRERKDQPGPDDDHGPRRDRAAPLVPGALLRLMHPVRIALASP